MAEFTIQGRSYACPVQLAVSAVSGKWKVLIVWHLRNATLRYGELRSRLPKVTHKMLAQQLRELEADGLINRTVYAVVPPKVEYALTERGRELLPALEALRQWGMRYKVAS
jgi:DNA-binding HxlR family transcriptional regulator